MSKMKQTLSYLWMLLCFNFKTNISDKKRWLTLSFFMLVQNLMFFSLWILLFETISDLKGWDLVHVARMFGIAATAIGLSLFLFNGIRSLAYRIQDGSIDLLLTKPRSALPLLLFSGSSAASLGDIVSGPLLWIFLGNVTPVLFAKLAFFTLLSSLLFTAVALMVYSVAFWMKSSTRFTEQLFEILIICSANIQHGQPILVQVVTHTILPAAFITLVPMNLIAHFEWPQMILLLSAVIFYILLSIKVFHAGLHRYKNAQT